VTIKIHLQDLKENDVQLLLDHSSVFFDLKDEEYMFNEPVKGEITFKLVGKNVLASGWIETRARVACVRCLEEFDLTLHAKVDLIYSNDEKLIEPTSEFDPETEILTYFEGETIDPRNELRELLMLELPFLPKCSPSCKGLCPYCGGNLNRNECTCKKKKEEEENIPKHDWKKQLQQIKLKNKT